MKRKMFLAVVLLSLSLAGFSQTNSEMTKLITAYSGNITFYGVINDVEFKQVMEKKKWISFIDGVYLDTVRFVALIYPLIFQNKVYFNADIDKQRVSRDPDLQKIVYSLADGSLTPFDDVFDYGVGMVSYTYDDRKLQVYLHDPTTGKETLFGDLESVANIDILEDGTKIIDDFFRDIFFLDKDRLYVTTCKPVEYAGDGCDGTRHFLVYGQNKLVDVTAEVCPKYDPEVGEELDDNYYSRMYFISRDKKYVKDLCHTEIYNRNTKQKVFRGYKSRIFNNEFKYIGEALPTVGLSTHICGFNIKNDQLLYYYMFTKLNTIDSTQKVNGEYTYKSVIIPYNFNPVLDLVMYKAYNNEKLNLEDIRGLEKYELDILRNLIFAKYNYAFSSEFYQAYFNLYEFYGEKEKKKSRVKDVSHLLTEIDKLNIEFIMGQGK